LLIFKKKLGFYDLRDKERNNEELGGMSPGKCTEKISK